VKKRKRLEVIECSGTAYEIGYQFGQATKKNIVKSVDALVARVNCFEKASKEEILGNAGKYVSLVESFDPELIEMLKGQAEGAGITFDEVFTLRCWFELRFYYRQLTTMCTAFAITGKATRGGKTIIGQNFDAQVGIALDLVKIKYNDGMEQLSLVFWGGGELTLTSAGLGIVLNIVLTPTNEQHLVVPCCCLMPKVMRQQRIGDALGVLCTNGRSMLHYAIASKDGEIFSVETRPDDFNVLQPVNDVLVHANHFLTERFKVTDSIIPEMRSDSYVRQQRLQRLIGENHGDLTAERMMEFMADHHNYPHSVCCHPDEESEAAFQSETGFSIIMVPEDKVMYVSYRNPCQYDYEEYKL
jgi:isopenicillin-N N-acyltransferase-like protein